MCPEAWGSLFRDSAQGMVYPASPKKVVHGSMLKDVRRFGHHFYWGQRVQRGALEGVGSLDSLDRPHPVRSKVAREEWVCGRWLKGGPVSCFLKGSQAVLHRQGENSEEGTGKVGFPVTPRSRDRSQRVEHRAQLRVERGPAICLGGRPPSSRCLG